MGGEFYCSSILKHISDKHSKQRSLMQTQSDPIVQP